MLRLKLQHFGHLIQRADSLEKTLMLGKSEDRREKEKGMTEDEMVEWHHRLNGHEFEQARSWWRTGKPGMQRVGHKWAAEQQRCQWLNWPSGEGNGTPFQYSCLENPMDGGAWWAAVHGVTKSRTRLSVFSFTSHFHALEKEMATHSSVLAWRIPGTGEPHGLPTVGWHRVRHDWSDLAAAAANWPSGRMREVRAPEVPGCDRGMPTVNWMEPDYSTGKMEKSRRVESSQRGLLNASPWLVTKILSLSCERVWLGSWLQGWASRQVQQELPGWGQENYIPRCYEV